MSEGLHRFFGLEEPLRNITVELFTPSEIKAFATGRVTVPNSIHADFTIEEGGLFCPEIFGAMRSGSDSESSLIASYDQKADTPDDLQSATGWYGRWGYVPLPTSVSHPWLSSCASWREQGVFGDVKLNALLILPPGLRPELKLPGGGSWFSSDFNYRYKQILRSVDWLERVRRGGETYMADHRETSNHQIIMAQTETAKHLKSELVDLIGKLFGCPCGQETGDRMSYAGTIKGGQEEVKNRLHELDALYGQGTTIRDGVPARLFTLYNIITAVGFKLEARNS